MNNLNIKKSVPSYPIKTGNGNYHLFAKQWLLTTEFSRSGRFDSTSDSAWEHRSRGGAVPQIQAVCGCLNFSNVRWFGIVNADADKVLAAERQLCVFFNRGAGISRLVISDQRL